jgi:amino acid transporter
VIIVSPTSNAVMALTCANYVLTPFFPNCEVPYGAVRLVAACVLLFITFVNCYNVRWATTTQNISMVTKVAALATIIVAAMVYVLIGREKFWI